MALFVIGVLLAWLTSGWLSRLGHGLWVFAAVAVVVVFVTGLIGFGRGKPVFVYNFLDLQRYKWEGPALSAGKHTVDFDFKYDGPGPAKGGTGVLSVDGKEVDRKTIEHTIPILMTIDETFDIGADTRTGVDDSAYELPFRFRGKIDKLTYNVGKDQMSVEDRARAAQMLARAKD